jgi:tetratricopeptide (TPR) repeat protein
MTFTTYDRIANHRRGLPGLTAFLILAAALAPGVVGCGGGGELDSETRKQFVEGNRLYLERQMEPALETFEKVLASNPGFVPARIMAGKIHFFGGRIDRARISFEQAVNTEGDNLDALYWLARVQSLDPATHQRALENIQLILAKDSTHIDAIYVQGRILRKSGKTSEALAAYQAAIQKGKKIALIHVEIGRIYRELNLNAEAERHFQTAQALGGQDAQLQKEIALSRER